MKNLLLILCWTFGVASFAQNYRLEIEVDHLEPSEVYLANFYGDRNSVIDTAYSDTTGRIAFIMPASYPSGMYRIFLTKEVFFDIIFNKEDIVIETDYNDLYESLVVMESEENQLYYEFLRTKHEFRRKFELLAPLNDYYPRTDSFFQTARTQYIEVQAGILVYMNDLLEKHPDRWVTRIIRQQKPLFFDPSMDEYARRDYLIEHFFDNYDFNDIELVRTNVYTSAAIEYMSMYSNPNYTQEQLENAFIKAVDKIMYETLDNSFVYEFIVEYLVGGFERYHFEKVLDYIAENYTPEQCENEDRKSDLQTRLTKYAELSIGKKAPNIESTDQLGNAVDLSRIKSDYTLVIFWASWCPHCNTMLPDIHAIYQSSINPKTMQVLSYSIDTEKEAWTKALGTDNFTWINASDLQGWDSQAAIDYNVYATPTMFLLDKQKNIVAKPITLDELKTALFAENLLR